MKGSERSVWELKRLYFSAVQQRWVTWCSSYPQKFLSSSQTNRKQMHLSQTSPHTAERGIQQRRENWSLWLTHPFVKWTFPINPSVRLAHRGWQRLTQGFGFFYLIFQSGEAQTFSPAIHGYAVWRLWKLEKIHSFGGVFHFLTPRGSDSLYTAPLRESEQQQRVLCLRVKQCCRFSQTMSRCGLWTCSNW